MYFQNALHSLVDAHLVAWNNKDIDCILNTFSDNAELESKFLNRIFNRSEDDKIIGKQRLKGFYSTLFSSPFYRTISLGPILKEGKSMTLRLTMDDTELVIKSCLVVDEYGKLNYLSFLRG